MTHIDFMEITKERKDKLESNSHVASEMFTNMYETVFTDGAVACKNKALAAIGMAIMIRCMECITSHVKKAISLGATKKEVLEIIDLAILMGGGPSRAYGAITLEVFDELYQNFTVDN